jgi:ribA/ribD-fused uncharacterized protein
MTDSLAPAPADRMPARVIDSFTGRYSFLSSFYVEPFVYAGMRWYHREGAFQAHKTLDPVTREQIAAMRTPKEAKAAGRAVVLRADWDDISKQVMLDVMLAQFRQSRHMAAGLTATGDATLIEGNTWHDQIWGDCQCGRAACAPPGLNFLGRCLEAVRFVHAPWVRP